MRLTGVLTVFYWILRELLKLVLEFLILTNRREKKVAIIGRNKFTY